VQAGLAQDGHGPWQAVPGPDASGALTLLGSGLLLLSRRLPVTRTERLVFSQRGDRMHDSDAWANKGAMLNTIDTGAGEIDVFQTHLYSGGGLKDNVPAALAAPLQIRDPTEDERQVVFGSELAELAAFYQQHHRPANVGVLTGDFNLDGGNIRQYGTLRRTTDALGLRDAWAWDVFGHPPADGYTTRDSDSTPRQTDFGPVCGPAGEPDGSGEYCEARLLAPRQPTTVGRFDFVFVEQPRPEHACRVELARVRRRPFRRASPTEGEIFLSDHLGLDFTLFVSRR
jgi:endonuclease/exonuclease/phosphatase family metal-dependent hydrolase